jgi:hypothetical protein
MDLIQNFLMQQASDSSVNFKFKFFQRLIEILAFLCRSKNLNFSENLSTHLVCLFEKFDKYKKHKSFTSFKLKSSISLIKLGVFNINCLGLIPKFMKIKHRKDALQLAKLILSEPLSDEVKSKIGLNEKYINTVVELMSKETGEYL